jgi:hypothetical protein
MSFTTLSRRKLLGTTAVGAAAVALTSSGTMASEFLPKSGCGHGSNHTAYSKKLGDFIHDPLVAEHQKNMAMRTASCPDCSVHLAAT